MAETSNADAMVSGLKIPDFPPLTSCTFPDVNGRIFDARYAQALYGLPGGRLIPKEADRWFKIFFKINETSSGDVEEVPMPSTVPGPSNSPRVTDQVSDQRTAKPIVTTSASLPFLGEGCDPSSLLTFDPDSIEPAAPKIGEEPNLGAVDGPLQRLKVLLSSPVDTLVEDPETIRGILVDIQPHLPGAGS
ncbi:hypothetical protein QYE76_018513 [Lolium multiflorum]|uniref:Uncharacterized protein n=1 Tax=Lolium multiflorum TaxID=4521 RepID=A0AAD8QH85_LOLMU|nr:hypothetical protein QYE76_018513 [Lolium multiflorum]